MCWNQLEMIRKKSKMLKMYHKTKICEDTISTPKAKARAPWSNIQYIRLCTPEETTGAQSQPITGILRVQWLDDRLTETDTSVAAVINLVVMSHRKKNPMGSKKKKEKTCMKGKKQEKGGRWRNLPKHFFFISPTTSYSSPHCPDLWSRSVLIKLIILGERVRISRSREGTGGQEGGGDKR